MYNLVSRITDGLGELKKLLETHIHNQGLAAIEKCGEAALNVGAALVTLKLSIPHELIHSVSFQDPKVYVQTTLDVHKKYNALVMSAFNNDAGFVAALDKVSEQNRIEHRTLNEPFLKLWLVSVLCRHVVASSTTMPSPGWLSHPASHPSCWQDTVTLC